MSRRDPGRRRAKPSQPKARMRDARALIEAGRWEQALEVLERVVERAPLDVDARVKYGSLLIDAGQLDAGLQQLDNVLELAPRHPQARMNRGLGLLQQGDFSRGWAEYRWRWQCPEMQTHPLAALPMAAWDGRPLHGQTILLHHEQGFGDTIQFARYAPLVAARGGRVVLGSPLGLKRLLRRVPGVDAVASADDPPVTFQAYASLMDLPGILGTVEDSVPSEVPYVHAEPELVDAWAARLGRASGLRVGLVWAGNPAHPRDARRSTMLSALSALGRVAGVELFSLQKGSAADEAVPADMRVVSLGPSLEDFADTAAVLMHMDVCVTVDTSVAHLAGALGRPVWLLLSAAHDWRWLVDREDSPWYPSMRIFRQRRAGDWAEVVERVAEALASLR